MVIDYYCFVMNAFGQNDYSEMKARNGSHIFGNLNFDINIARNIGKFAVFCKETGRFYDSNWNELSLKDKRVLLRCIIPDEKIAFDALEAEGANLVSTREDHKKIMNWASYINPMYREINSSTYGEFIRNFENYQEKYGRVFFKTKQKHISCEVKGVVALKGSVFSEITGDDDIGKTVEHDSNTQEFSSSSYIVFTNKYNHSNDFRFNFLDKTTEVYVQPCLEIVKDEEFSHIPVEYRSFVVDGKFVSSRSWIPNRCVPEEVKEITQKFIDALPESMSKTFVIDILQFVDKDGNKHYDLCELNPITSSGYEQGSTIFVLEDLPNNVKYYIPEAEDEDDMLM